MGNNGRLSNKVQIFPVLHIMEVTFFSSYMYYTLDILFSSNHNIHKSSSGLCFWASDPLIDKSYKNLSIKGSEAQKQRPHKLL